MSTEKTTLPTIEEIENVSYGTYTKRQQIFLKYALLLLTDLIVLNFFHEYWGHVFIASFSLSLLTAVFLQVMLQITIIIEHRVGLYFKSKTGKMAKVQRILAIWAILFISKLAILHSINLIFGDSVSFSGPIEGIIAFIVVVIVIIIAEQIVRKVYDALGEKE